jgi:hypothetical protein
MVESSERGLMRRIANPLKLGEQYEQYFVLGHHWPEHLNRKIADAATRGLPASVGDLRAWLDEPRPMGLPQEIADLVITVFAEQTNRSIIIGQRPTDVSVLRQLPADAPVIEQALPEQENWEEARARAQAMFGIGGVSELRTARNVSLLAEQVRTASAQRLPEARRLLDLLLSRGPAVLGAETAADGTARAKIADGAVRLCEAIADAGDDVALIRVLGTFSLPTAALHVGRSLGTAVDVVRAADRVDWPIYVSVAGWGPEHALGLRARSIASDLAAAWEANEYATPLQPALTTADSAARQLLLEANRRPVPGGQPMVGTGAPPAPQPGLVLGGTVPGEARVAAGSVTGTADSGERDVDAVSVGEVTAILNALTGQGKRVHVTWRVER